MTKIYIGGAFIILAIGAIYWFSSTGTNEPEAVVQTEQQEENTGNDVRPEGVKIARLVTITDEGYSPKELSLVAGEIVVFKNDSSRPVWTASAVHPTHTVYPESDIRDCNSDKVMFDSCSGVDPEGMWEFQFNEVGEWGYHNHLNPSNTGKITVQ
tara:strand:+ start:451 stop:915 length:465 start_codon:yes stop_codon:yes gene_type:complete